MFDPSNMEKMMKQMGMDMEEMDAEKVTVETSDGKELVFDSPQLNKMEVQGKVLFQLQGDYQEKDEGDEEDVELVMERTGASREEAEAALEDNDDLTDAIMSLD
ncbi:MAG: nascent polypeptide-associated complex protein [Candidatus Nanohaloarchaeota archaeon QJJ-7]|nr:nascent polypeptide-associated complex protein [Candidatus Nanohaloarchaeota archaeon QJJ-7]